MGEATPAGQLGVAATGMSWYALRSQEMPRGKTRLRRLELCCELDACAP